MQANDVKEINKVVYLSNNDILPNRFQPRKYFDEEEIMQLSESIKEHGVINPVIVRKLGDKYELVAGERRYKANILAGNDDIPAIIMDVNDKESSEIAVVENIQRKDLNAIEEAISYKRILDIGYMTQEQLAQKMGKSQSAIANKIRLLKLSDEVQDALMKKQISERHARSLLKLESQKKQNELLEKIINERLTVRKTDEEIEKMNNNINGYSSNYNNTPTTLDPIMPVSNVADVNISGVQQTPQMQSSNVQESNIQPPIINNNQVDSIASFNDIIKPESNGINVQNIPVESNQQIHEETIPTMSIDDVLAKANQPSVAGSELYNQNSQQENFVENSYGMPEFNPINEHPTPILQSQSNSQGFKVPILNPINESPIENMNQTFSDSQTLNNSNNNLNSELSGFEMPNLTPISENPAPVDDFINSNFNTNINRMENNERNTSENIDSFNSFVPFSLNKEDSTKTSPIATSPIIDTTTDNNDNQLNNVGLNIDNNINNGIANGLNTDSQSHFEKVPEPIIVNDYNDQYDPIMPKTQNQQPTIDFKTIINLIRKCSQAIENSGYKIETEEYNLDNLYQVVFKIDKH